MLITEIKKNNFLGHKSEREENNECIKKIIQNEHGKKKEKIFGYRKWRDWSQCGISDL